MSLGLDCFSENTIQLYNLLQASFFIYHYLNTCSFFSNQEIFDLKSLLKNYLKRFKLYLHL